MITIDDLLTGSAPASRDEAVALMAQLAAAQQRLAVALAGFAVPGAEDRLLDVDEAAVRLKVDAQWLYRRTSKLPFVVRLDGAVRFSARGIDAYIAAKRAR